MKNNTQNISSENNFHIPNKEIIDRESKLQEQLWREAQVKSFNDLLKTHYKKSSKEFSKIVLDELCMMCNAFSGVIYGMKDDKETMNALAGFACLLDKLENPQIKLGSGLIGQAWDNGKPLFFENITPDNITLKISTAAINAASIFIVPLVFNNVVHGVVEFTFVHHVDPKHKRLLESICKDLAPALESVLYQEQNLSLLNQAQVEVQTIKKEKEALDYSLEELSVLKDQEKELLGIVEEMKKREAVTERRIKELEEILNNKEDKI